MRRRENLDDYVKQQLIGFIISKSREEQKISQTMLAKMVNKSKQYISEIEKGFKRISIATINDIFSNLNIVFNYCTLGEIDNLFNKFIEEFNYGNIERAQCFIGKVLIEQRFKYSYEYPKYCLAELINDLLSHTHNEVYYNEVKEQLSFYFYEYKAYAYFFLGEFERKERNLIQAIRTYNFAIESLKTDNQFIGNVYWSLAVLYDSQNQLIKAIYYNKEALSIFQSHRNYNKALAIDLHLGNAIAKMLFYDEALRQYKKTNKEAKLLKNEFIKELSIRNIYVTYFYMEKYSEAIKFINKEKCRDIFSYYILAWSYFRLGKKEQSFKYLNLVNTEELNDHLYIKKILSLLRYRLNEDISTQYFYELNEFYDYTVKFETVTEQIHAISLFIEYFILCNNYEQAYYYQAKILNHYKQVDKEVSEDKIISTQ